MPIPHQQPSSNVPYPVRWLKETLTPANAEALLAHERDSGLLSPHDFALASRFYTRQQAMQWQYANAAAGFFGTILLKRPKWSAQKSLLASLWGASLGYTIGLAQNRFCHIVFVRSLEDPAGFVQAIQGIQKRVGSPFCPPIIMIPHPAMHALTPAPAEDLLDGQPNDMMPLTNFSQSPHDTQPHTDYNQTPNPLILPALFPPGGAADDTSAPALTQPSGYSIWDRIRAANSRTTRNSSWDHLRQQHERIRSPSTDTPHHVASVDDERTTQQARFDALLEAERNVDTGSSTR